MLPNTHALAPSDLLARETPAGSSPIPTPQGCLASPVDWEGQRFPGGRRHPGT